MRPRFNIWTGGGPFDPADRRCVNALAALPEPEPLPRSALLTFWWGEQRHDFAVVACSVRTTRWGGRRMTWLHIKGKPTRYGEPDLRPRTITLLVPAEYVTAVQPGPGYTITQRGTDATIGVFPPRHPAPPHALTLAEIERGLAGLRAAPADIRPFEVRYPVFALRRPDGSHLGFGPSGARPVDGEPFGVAVFTTRPGADRFLREFAGRAGDPGIRVESFDDLAAFRRFLRSVGAGVSVLFDPSRGPDGFVFADHSYPAAVVRKRFLPRPAWQFGYPVYVLCGAGPGLTLHIAHGTAADGTPHTVLPVFTDDDLADRALPLAGPGATAVAVPTAAAFAQLLRDLPAGMQVMFDHEQTRPVNNRVMGRDDLLANLEDLEL